ncbi:MAG: FAD-dependent oxidoreductase [Syntrophales bacterium]
MSTVSFSSWNGKFVDNRKGTAKPVDVRFPERLNGSKFKVLMGWNGIVARDPNADIPSITFHYLKTVRKLSCGECSVCMIGIDKLLEIFRKMGSGKGSRKDLAAIRETVEGVTANSKCNFGGSSLSPVLDAIRSNEADFIALIEGKRRLTEKEYSVDVSAPCMKACPAKLDIPGYIELIRNFRFRDSLNLIRERCILPGVIGRACPAPCEDACVRVDMDEPLAIRLLKRAAADYDLEQGGSALTRPAKEKDEKVAIVGAGPAGLAAAYHLRSAGYKVTVFESLPYGGGMAAAGIPDYRLPKNIINHEIDLIRQMGVDIKLNTKIDRLDLKELQKKGYKAVFLAAGAQKGIKIGCRGEDEGYDGYVDGVEFLKDFSLGKKVEPRKKVVIIGGGNVALDCARTCVRLGFGEVEILYRRSRAEMPAHAEEIEAAMVEGVKFSYLSAPLAVVSKDGRITGIECIKMKLGEPDESGRRRPIPVKGSEFTLKTDMVIPATGQKPDISFLKEVKLTGWGTVHVDPVTYRTSVEGVFAGGDCVTGPATLVEALDAGNNAARSIDCYLQGKKFEREVRFKDIDPNETREQIYVPMKLAEKARVLEPRTRIESFVEVEGGFGPASAMQEAKRCLRCYRVIVWE